MSLTDPNKIRYSAYRTSPTSDTYIRASLDPYLDDDIYRNMLYLSGVIITNNAHVDIYSASAKSEVYSKMILPDGTSAKTEKQIINAHDVTITGGGKMVLDHGAIASNTIISGSSRTSATEIVNGGWSYSIKDEKADPGVQASSIDAQVFSNGSQIVSGGYTSNTIVHSGGSQVVKGITVSKRVYNEIGIPVYPFPSSSFVGVAENTTVLDGGTLIVGKGGYAQKTILRTSDNTGNSAPKMIVSNSGTANETQIHNGNLTVSSGGILSDATLYADGNLTVKKGATLANILFAAKSFDISSGVKFDDFELCFDLANVANAENFILNEDMFEIMDGNVTYSIYASPFAGEEKEVVYSIINTGEEFNDSITILNRVQASDGSDSYYYGNQLVLNKTIHDNLGNGYTLNVTEDKTYTVTFTNNTVFSQAKFASNKLVASGSFTPEAGKNPGLYGVQIEIDDPSNSISDSDKRLLLNSLSGTVYIKEKGNIITSFDVNGAYIEGKAILLEYFNKNDIIYDYNLKYDKSLFPDDFDKYDFTVNVIMSNVTLDNTDNEDDKWQSLPESSSIYSNKSYIFTPEKSGKINITAEYVGYKDNSDYRRINITQDCTFSIAMQAISLSGASSKLSLALYQATGDGSKLKKIFSTTQSIVSNSFGISDMNLEAGVYYIEVSAQENQYINYQSVINTEFYDPAKASNNDDNIASTIYYTEEEDEFSEIEINDNAISDWVGFGDTVDYRLLDIDDPAKFNLSITNSNAASPLKIEVIQVLDGKQKSLFSITVKSKISEDKPYKTKDIYLNPDADAQYFVKVTGTKASKGENTDYTIKLEATENTIFKDAENDDDIAAGAEKVEKNENNYLVENNYLGFGDLTDYFKFDIEKSGEYSFTLESTLKSGAQFTLYRLYDDGKVGTVPLQSILKSGAPKNYNSKSYFVTTKSVDLMEGTYYLQVTGGNKANDSKNTYYSVKLNENSTFAALPAEGTLKKGEFYILDIEDYKRVNSNAIKSFTFYQDNGKNKLTKVTVKDGTLLAPGTYYISPNSNADAKTLNFADTSAYNAENITDNNSWKAEDVSNLVFDENNKISVGSSADKKYGEWVGFGDGINYYKISVGAENAGSSEIKFKFNNFAESKNVSVALYYVKTDKNGVQSLAKASTKFDSKTNTLTVANMLAQDYYLCIQSKSYANADKAKNASYNFVIDNDEYKMLSKDRNKRSLLDKNEYATISLDPEAGDVQLIRFIGSKYTLYKNNGKGGFAAVKVYDNKVLLDSSETYYLKSTANDNKFYYTTTEIDTDENWIGLNNASDSWEFNTFESGSRWEVFTIAIEGKSTVSASTKFTLTLYKEDNGAWKKVSSTTASYTEKSGKETIGKLSVNLDADTNYKFEVSTSDKGAGSCAGYYDFEQKTFAYDLDNNMFQSATVPEAKAEIDAAVTKKGDSVDFYDISSFEGFDIELDTDIDAKAAIKITFYDENYNVVKFKNEDRKEVSNLTLNSKNDDFTLASLNDAIKFVRIDASGSEINSYTLSDTAD